MRRNIQQAERLNTDRRLLQDNEDLEHSVKDHLVSSCRYFELYAIIALFLLVGAVFCIDSSLPAFVEIEQEKENPDVFVGERARNDLKVLTEIGPRVVGSYENEILAVGFLKAKILEIIKGAHKNQKIEMDIQVVSGGYYLKTVPVGKINTYSNVQNVVVKIYAQMISNNSVLVNSHFDSVPTSPGASDDGINCVAMLEVLRKLSKLSTRPLHNIIFLFNGAEESSLQAAHGFITKHKWAHESKVILNLEAAGSGGKIVLFQTGPNRPWLTEVYGIISNPSGQSASEELFQANMIPSDTDFRVFRDFGNMVGMDMAFVRDGYRYHTKYDNFDAIPLGSYQHVGNTVLFLIKNLANNPEIDNKNSLEGNMVYFDYLGSFFVRYSTNKATVINILFVLLSFGIFLISLHDFHLGYSVDLFLYLIKLISATMTGYILSIITVLTIAFMMDLLGFSMRWYGHPILAVGLFSVPTIIILSFTSILVQPKNISLNINCQIQAHIHGMIWSILLLITTVMGLRSTYPLLLVVSSNSLALLFIYAFGQKYSGNLWKIVYILCSLPSTVFGIYTSINLLAFFIPMTGRIGSEKNPDVIIGFLTCICTLLSTSQLVPLTSTLNEPKKFLKILGVMFCAFMIFALSPLGFPYSGDFNSPTPQRHWILHTKRIFHGDSGDIIKQDSGFLMLNMDRNSPYSLNKYVKELSRKSNIEEDCTNFLLCGLPLAHHKMVQIIKSSTWIPASQPVNSEHPVKLIVNSKVRLNQTTTKYNISIYGPSHVHFYISPKKNINVLKISLLDELPEEVGIWNGRPYYFVVHISGKEIVPSVFQLEVETPENYNDTALDIAVSGIYVHDKQQLKTAAYSAFLSQFPDWADITAWVSIHELFVV